MTEQADDFAKIVIMPEELPADSPDSSALVLTPEDIPPEPDHRQTKTELSIAEHDIEDEPTCPFCGGALSDGRVTMACQECKTPHHVECWGANQGCTTVGCKLTPKL